MAKIITDESALIPQTAIEGLADALPLATSKTTSQTDFDLLSNGYYSRVYIDGNPNSWSNGPAVTNARLTKWVLDNVKYSSVFTLQRLMRISTDASNVNPESRVFTHDIYERVRASAYKSPWRKVVYDDDLTALTDSISDSVPTNQQFITNVNIGYEGFSSSDDYYLPDFFAGDGARARIRVIKDGGDPANGASVSFVKGTQGGNITVRGTRDGVAINQSVTDSGSISIGYLEADRVVIMDFLITASDGMVRHYDIYLEVDNLTLNGYAKIKYKYK